MPGHRHGLGHSYRGQLFWSPPKPNPVPDRMADMMIIMSDSMSEYIINIYQVGITPKCLLEGKPQVCWWNLSLFWLNLHSEMHFEEPL